MNRLAGVAVSALKYFAICFLGLCFLIAASWIWTGREKFQTAWREANELPSCAAEFWSYLGNSLSAKQRLVQLSRSRLSALGQIHSQGSAHIAEIEMLPYIYIFLSEDDAKDILLKDQSHCSAPRR